MISNIICRDSIIEDIVNGKVSADAVIVPMSIYNSMNNGFAYDVAINFPQVKEYENMTPYGDKRKYGTVTKVNMTFVTWLLCYMHTGGYTKDKDDCFADIESLKKCLLEINEKYKNKNVISTLIGASIYDGNLKKDTVVNLFNEYCKDVNLILYDYDQKDRKLEIFRKLAELRAKIKNKEITSEEYKKERNKIEWVRKNGWIKKMPDDYEYHSNKKNIFVV